MKIEVVNQAFEKVMEYNVSVEALIPQKGDTITVDGKEMPIIGRKIETDIQGKRGHHSVTLYV